MSNKTTEITKRWASRPERETNESRELLIKGYCDSITKHAAPGSDMPTELTFIIELYLRNLSTKSKQAICSANWFTEIINDFQNNENNKCPFITDKNDEINLLNHIYVRGGSLRDTILSRDINDIDIVIDTQKLTKYYTHHLTKYHSKLNEQSLDCPCYLWQRYINMYKVIPNQYPLPSEPLKQINEIKRLETNITRADFLLNAKFIKDIIINYSNSNSVYLDAVNTWEYTNWVINVSGCLLYQGINLNGARFDISDESSNSIGAKTEHSQDIILMNIEQNKNISQWNECFDYISELKYPLFYSQERDENVLIDEIKQNYDIIAHATAGETDNDVGESVISIVLPEYNFNMKYSTQFCDFTINGIRLPISQIYDSKTKNIDFNWYSKILNYSIGKHVNIIHNKNGIMDIKNKIIRQPDLNTLCLEYVYDDYFWRYIKILSKFSEYIYHNIWTLDENTLKCIKDAYKAKFKVWTNALMKEFASKLMTWNIKSSRNYKKDFEKRLMVFRIIGFEKYLKKALKKSKQYKSFLYYAAVSSRYCKVIYEVLHDFGYKNVYWNTMNTMYQFKESIHINYHEYYYNFEHRKFNAIYQFEAKYANFNKYSNQMIKKKFSKKANKYGKYVDVSKGKSNKSKSKINMNYIRNKRNQKYKNRNKTKYDYTMHYFVKEGIQERKINEIKF